MTDGPVGSARRILILAPHPDDEIVACGIAAMRAAAAGAQVSVLYLTTGVPGAAALWPWQRAGHAARVRRRGAEAREAAALIGIDRVVRSAGVPPADAAGTAAVPRHEIPSRRLRDHLDDAANAIAAAIDACAAEALWVPAFEGGHQDHDAANAVAASLSCRLPVWEFAAYNFAGGKVGANRFPEPRGGEFTIAATPAEAERKRRALACYASERGNLRHVGAEREVGRPLPAHDYGRPPHGGRLSRERFHWVPFRHPRIDFAPSAEIYRDIGRWASARVGRPAPALGNRPGGEAGQPDREFAGALDEAEGEGGIRR